MMSFRIDNDHGPWCGRKRLFSWSQFYTKHHHFTKTGSGQTEETLRNTGVLFCRPVHPARPTYEGANLLYETAMKASAGGAGGPLKKDFVLNTYLSLHDPFSPAQICGGSGGGGSAATLR